MLDNLTLVAVHTALAILVWRLIRTPDPDEAPRPPLAQADRFRRRTGADD